MSTWTDIRDIGRPHTWDSDTLDVVGAAAVSPYAAQAEILSGDVFSDIPGVSQAQELYQGVTGQTAADAAMEASSLQQDAIKYAADLQYAATERGLETQQEMFQQTRADQMPWLEAGGRALTQLEQMMGQAPTFEDYTQSDYSKFIQEQGLKALEAKGLAGGYYNTGATSKDMMQYGQDIAGQDYQQFLGNYYQSLNPYMSMAGLGQQQAQSMGQQGMQSAAQQAQYGIQGANAQAGGITGAAQAQAGGILDAADARSQGISNLLGMGGLLYGISR